VVLGVLVEQLGGQRGLNNVLEDVGAELFGGDGFGVLAGDDDGVDADRLVVGVVRDGDLRSGRRYGSLPDLRTSESLRVSLWASEIGVGINSGVSLVA
jgi:hypothetical protein